MTDAPATFQVLRDKSAVTRLLILAELERDPGVTYSDIADRLGVTVQAVSAYGKALIAEGLLDQAGAATRVTPPGRQRLHEGVRHLRAAVDAVAAPLAVIRVTSAVAAADIREGDRVGLYMERGDLSAKPRMRTPSTGRALHAAHAGDEIVVGDLTGLVELQPGRIVVIAVPSPAEGGTRLVDMPRLRSRLKEFPRADKVGAVGTGARVLAARIHGTIDFEFAAERAVFNAAERGLDARLFVSRERLPDVIRSFEDQNAGTLRRVGIELVEAPEVPR